MTLLDLTKFVKKVTQADVNEIDMELARMEGEKKILESFRSVLVRRMNQDFDGQNGQAKSTTTEPIQTNFDHPDNETSLEPSEPAKPKEKRASPYQASQAAHANENRKSIARYLDKNGAASVTTLATALGMKVHNVYYYVNCTFFEKTPRGIVLTPDGRQNLLDY